jgi:outer membrane protein assembly factor BamB
VPFGDQAGTKLTAFQRDWSPKERPKFPNVAIGVVNDHMLVGRASGHARWRFEHPIESRPIIAGELVVTMGGGKLVGLDATSGEEHWKVKAEGRLTTAAQPSFRSRA